MAGSDRERPATTAPTSAPLSYAARARASIPLLTVDTPTLGVLRLVPETELPAESRLVADRMADGPAPPNLSDAEPVYPVNLRVTTIGRTLTSTICLLDPAISREHACLALRNDGWEIENVSRHNPLWVDACEVAPGRSARVPSGALLRLGSTTLQALLPSPTPHVLAPHTALVPLASGVRHIQSSSGDTSVSGGARIFSPGVTLQFALRGKLRSRVWLALAALCLGVFLISALLTLGLTSLIGQVALSQGGWRQVAIAVTIPLIPVVGVVALVAALDRYEREPPLLLFGAFLWGALIAIPPTLYFEHGLDALLLALAQDGGIVGGLAQAALQAAIAGVVEETMKGAGLLLLLLIFRDEFDNVTDGLLYGALIGAGFALVENFIYFAVTPRAEVGFLLVGRVALGWLTHSTFTALFGAGLGYARETRSRRVHWQAPLIGLLAAMLLHTYFDGIAFAAETLAPSFASQSVGFALSTLAADYLPLFVTELALLRVALAALRREAALVREYLAEEVSAGVVTPDEYIFLQNASLRNAAERYYGLTWGWRVYLTARALYQTETGLAFRLWHVQLGDPLKPGQRQPEDAYRERITRLRRSLTRMVNTFS